MGFDYNLQKKCFTTPGNPGSPLYLEDRSECTPGNNKHWYLANAGCTGNLAINDPRGPMSIEWKKYQNAPGTDTWSVRLKTDFTDIPNPCARGAFTWFTLMDHQIHGGGPLPKAENSWMSVLVNFNDHKPTPRSATRAFAAWQGRWEFYTGAILRDGSREKKSSTFLVEVNFYLDSQWGHRTGLPEDIVTYDSGPTYGFYYIALNGALHNSRIFVEKGVTKKLVINWTGILNDMINRGYFPRPIGGLPAAISTATFVATEVRNNESGVGGPMTDLWFANFRLAGTP